MGERSALNWLIDQGATVYLPFGHSPDIDLIANFGDLVSRVQVKTTTVFRNARWVVSLATRGGNQSWSGLVKYFDAQRCDHLFVLVADGRRWFIPPARWMHGPGLSWADPSTRHSRSIATAPSPWRWRVDR